MKKGIIFGSKDKRDFKGDPVKDRLGEPGPGAYMPEHSIQLLNQKNDGNIKKSSSMFLSRVIRNAPSNNNIPSHKLARQAAPGQYNVDNFTIANEMKKKTKGYVESQLKGVSNFRLRRTTNDGPIPFNSQ